MRQAGLRVHISTLLSAVLLLGGCSYYTKEARLQRRYERYVRDSMKERDRRREKTLEEMRKRDRETIQKAYAEQGENPRPWSVEVYSR